MHECLRGPVTIAVVLALGLAACGGSAAPASEEPAPSDVATSPSPTTVESVTSTPTAGTADVVVTKNVAFESSSLNALGLLDVYAPPTDVGLPVVVMFHGNPMSISKSYLAQHATRVAELGFVVFVPTWGHSGGAEYNALTPKDQLIADGAQAACALAFSAEHAEEYGGNADSLTVFGHSAGGNIGSIVVLERPELAEGCLARVTPQVDEFVAWDGDWLLVGALVWDGLLADDPTIIEAITPWAHLPAPPDLHFVMLEGETAAAGRSETDARGPDGWLAQRDPDGAFLAALEKMGAFDDGSVDSDDSNALLIDTLAAQGADVVGEVLPGSGHERLSDAGWRVFLQVFEAIGG